MTDHNDPQNPNDEIEITENDVPESASTINCSQCDASIPEGEAIATENAVFCPSCYQQLTTLLQDSLAEQDQDINYLGATVGGLLGGALGAIVWWGFTIVTNIQFGLVAVLIGWAAGKGVVILSGGKRALPLQLISVGATLVSYGFATYWVTRSLFQKYIAESSLQGGLPFIPDPALFIDVVFSGFELFDIIFVAIALWQAWKMPAPIVLQKED